MTHRIQMEGRRYGYWTVVEYLGPNLNGQSCYRCQCDCGTIRVVVAQPLRTGRTISCGCQKADTIAVKMLRDGKAKTKDWTPEYRAWVSMRSRCRNNKALYVDRGITVCERWMLSFQAFMDDMGPIPVKGYTLDRIDNDKGYEPGNCRWTDAQTQAINRRSTVNK